MPPSLASTAPSAVDEVSMRQVIARIAASVVFSMGTLGCVEVVESTSDEPAGEDVRRGDQAAAAAPTSDFVVTIDGMGAKPVVALSGGVPVAVVTAPPPGSQIGTGDKTINGRAVSELALTTDITFLEEMQQFVEDIHALRNTPPARDIAVSQCTPDRECFARRRVDEARPIEVTLPLVEAGSRVQFKAKLSGGVAAIEPARDPVRGPGPSRVSGVVGGMEVAFDGETRPGVVKVELPTIRRVPAANGPGNLSIGNLKVTVAGAGVEPWLEWYRQNVLSNDRRERELRVDVLEADLDGTLFSVKFDRVGMVRYEDQPMVGKERTVVFELYAENVDLDP
jgi:hypothetical protein